VRNSTPSRGQDREVILTNTASSLWMAELGWTSAVSMYNDPVKTLGKPSLKTLTLLVGRQCYLWMNRIASLVAWLTSRKRPFVGHRVQDRLECNQTAS
jgi:hypothetical protein